ncbi:matrixin family metalloprotease [uncultured Sulfitobacter sp.]|uniref:M10 family metallopeptidase n=1 Tax=uncultured Sulfitobacter sp. TaxID=191468 RepID=UPI00262961E9|nr:matrixin family metalloprotease [uncultured Sulfitobacter sp.]
MNFFFRDDVPVAGNDVLSLTKSEAAERWNHEASLGTPVVVSYSFPTQAAPYDTLSGAQDGFDGFTPAHRAHARTALETWEAASGIRFVEVTDSVGGDIRFGMIDMTGRTNATGNPLSGFAYYPSDYEYGTGAGTQYLTLHDNIGGDIFLNRDYYLENASTITPGVRGYSILLHEVGHALGLRHPFEGEPVISSDRDNGTFTVMSYDRSRGTTQLGTLDREAMALLYGAPERSLDAAWDGASATMRITGTGGSDTVLGSHLDDVLTGGAGDDILSADAGDNILSGGAGDDRFVTRAGSHVIDGGTGTDRVLISGIYDTGLLSGAQGRLIYDDGGDLRVEMTNVAEVWFDTRWYGGTLDIVSTRDLFGPPTEARQGSDADEALTGTDARDSIDGGGGNDTLAGGLSDDTLGGGAGDDRVSGDDGDDLLDGGAGADTIEGGTGVDTLIGGAGDDMLTGGRGVNDLRDEIFGGAGNDVIDGGYGNDALRGDAGDDVIAGGFGADTVLGGTGDDTLTGSALGDQLFGGDGDDFVNGGFGFDRVNGGGGADSFFHLGVENHGADWIQDYDSGDGDTLVFGNAAATRAQFQINEAFTPGAGAADVADAFIIYRPTGQIMWALVDGTGQDQINLSIGGEIFDLTV